MLAQLNAGLSIFESQVVCTSRAVRPTAGKTPETEKAA